MNPSHTNRLRPRDRVSPGPSPLSSPTLNRRSGSLPVTCINDQRDKNEKSLTRKDNLSSAENEISEEIAGNHQSPDFNVNEKANIVYNKSRPRSGSWGGASESDEEIKVSTS